ncbi:TraU family protein [Candidatus Tisiphia endosymbiont of Thecophora atra]|uniref:TraU family protein n=1 Tax=Candidatus Tisiphia endosymbiont of Thecophora atra TaxID=3066258 RepID=UPI00312CA0A3
MPFSVSASITCQGHFVNPITDICWSCILPISIGNLINIGSGVRACPQTKIKV